MEYKEDEIERQARLMFNDCLENNREWKAKALTWDNISETSRESFRRRVKRDI